MSKIISFILSFTKTQLFKILQCVLNFATELFKYLNAVHKDKKEKEQQKKTEEFHKKVDNVCDNGNISDLIDLRK